MSIASEIERLQNAKADLKTSINAKTDSSHQITDETIDDYADFVDSIQTGGGGGTPEKGIIISNWNSDGQPETAEIKGYTEIPSYYLSISGDSVFFHFKTIIMPNNVISIGSYGFSNNRNATAINIPSTVTSIGSYAFRDCRALEGPLEINASTIGGFAFQNCQKIKSVKLNGNMVLVGNVFKSCTALKKVCMPNVTGVFGTNTKGPFEDCTALKQVWLGSNVTNNRMERYSFYTSGVVEKIYIDLPRATVEAFTNYQYGFVNNASRTGAIVCNDDEGFITEAQFDALDPDNM